MIRNILFDLGHVIVDIDFCKTHDVLQRLGWSSQAVKAATKPAFMDAFEVGEIDVPTFIHEMRKRLPNAQSNEEVIHAWNAMLVGIRKDTIEILQTLAKNYTLLIYSNTNTIHAQWIDAYLQTHYGWSTWPEDLVKDVYYSQVIGHRKPNPEGFQLILEETNIRPEETVFIDDLLDNLNTARSMGFQIVHKTPTEDLGRLLERNGFTQ